MATRKITPVGRSIGRTRPGETLRLSAAKAAALVAVGRARYVAPTPVPAPTPQPPVRRQRRMPELAAEPELDAEVEIAPVIEPDSTIETETPPDPEAEDDAEREDDGESAFRISPRTGKPVRTYRRRDLTAEE